MPIFNPFKRNSQRSLLLEINPFQLLAAVIQPSADGPVKIECIGEFDAGDDSALRVWLDGQFGAQRNWIPAYCSFTPADTILHRESLQPRKLTERAYLGEQLRDVSQLHQPEHWTLAALDPLEGTPLTAEGTARPGLLFAVAHADIQRAQQRMLDHRLLPRRLEFGLLPLIGTIAAQAEQRNERRASVVIVIEQEHTTAYILGKEGVHTPARVPHGFASIAQAVRREFGLETSAEVQHLLNNADDVMMLRATKFVRDIGRDLKPLVDSYEMTTGQPVGEIHCAYLPATLQWIAEPLAQVIQRPVLAMDCMAWLPGARLQAAEDLPPLGPHWLGALGAVATPRTPADEPASTLVPWRLDCRLSAALPNTRLVGRRFVTGALVTALAAFVATHALWQAYVIRSLNEDTAYWNAQMASHQQLFDALTRTTQVLRAKSTRFDQAYELVRMPHQVSDLILNLGRHLPPNMQVHRIEANPGRVAMSGTLREPPEQSSRTLGRYMEEMRQTPAIGPLFSSITLTSLQRENDSDDSLLFEISFTLAEASP